ncbi:MAG: four-carbon acid sugar kinase family protein [bacterium]
MRNQNRPLIAIIADDLTGCGDAGYSLSLNGLRSQIITSPVKSLSSGLCKHPVIIFNTESRNASSKLAYKRVRHVSKIIRQLKPRFVFKKTDSTLRGNLGAELDAFMEVFELSSLCFIPAYPKMGRLTKNLKHYCNDKPLDTTFFSDDPRKPVKTSYLPELLSKQSKYFSRIQLFDVFDQMMLEKTVKTLKGDYFAGSAGFLEELLHKWINAKDIKSHKSLKVPLNKPSGDTAVICGSINPISIGQLESFYKANSGVKRLPYGDHSIVKSEIFCYKRSKVVFIYREFSKNRKSTVIMSNLLALAQSLNQMYNLSNFILMGGETAYRVCNRFKFDELEVVAGLDRGITLTKAKKEVQVVLKPGGFGDKDFLIKIIKMFGLKK